MRETGVIKFFGKKRRNPITNFGFIKREDGNEVYIHKDNACYTIAELAERLGLEESIIESEKLKPNLSEWSINKDPKAIEWEYLSSTNNFYPVSLPEGMRVTFEVVTNTEKGKEEAKSLRLLLNQQTSILESLQPEQKTNITTSISEDSIDDIDLNSLDAYYPLSRNIKVKSSLDFSEYFKQLQLIKRVSTVDFIYCLYLEKLDAIYWGMTSNLTQRMQQHYRGEVKSTREEAVKGQMWILYTLPFKAREDAEKVEQQAWSKSGGGLLTNNDCSRGRQTFLGVECAGTVARMDFAYRHLINLGWTGTKITLKDFLSNTSKYLHLWDEIGNNINYDVLAEIFDLVKIREQIRNRSSRKKSDNSEITSDISTVKKLRKNEVKYLVQYSAELNNKNQKVISGVIITPVIIIDCKNNNTFDKSILYLEAYETKEEAQKALKNVDYQIPNIYLYLLNHGWNGRIFNTQLLLSALSQINNIQKYYCHYPHNERLKILRKYIIGRHQDEQSYHIANIERRLSTSANINWRTLVFPQEWIDIYEDYEFQQQNLVNQRRLKTNQNKSIQIDSLKALLLLNSNTSDQFVAESHTTDSTTDLDNI
ncbi:MAG: GIY-YIG nuclease family protein [Nostoc sp.]|uniref:GIY-YIG nuclease family protein n=1 Tax=Nostoc sp. TaxID=1180 RepID=UPI002FFC177A